MIDIIEKIIPLLDFQSKDDFYYVQVLQRRKDNPELNLGFKIIKEYSIISVKQLRELYSEIKTLCDVFNARAAFRLNKRSFRQVAMKTLVNISNQLTNRAYDKVVNAYKLACRQCHHDKNKKWVVDIDADDITYDGFVNEVKEFIETLPPQKETSKILLEVPTKTGIHLITNPFHREKFKAKYKTINIQGDSFVNLYIP